jgi:hypothetical protein
MSSYHKRLSIFFVASVFAALFFVVPQAQAATITIDDTCSWDEAIQNANDDAQTNADCEAGSGTDTIAFNLNGGSNDDQTLTGGTATITSPVVIDGTTQGDATCGVADNLGDRDLDVELDFQVKFSTGSDGSSMRGISILADASAHRLVTSGTVDGLTFTCNNFGIDATGNASGATRYDFAELAGTLANVTFGGNNAGDGNVFAGSNVSGQPPALDFSGSTSVVSILNNIFGKGIGSSPTAFSGAGIFVFGCRTGCTHANWTIQDNVFENTTYRAIDISNINTVTVQDSVFDDTGLAITIANSVSNINIIDNVIGGGTGGVRVALGENVTIQGNKLGTNAAGTIANPIIFDGASSAIVNLQYLDNVLFGGPDADDRNIISGNIDPLDSAFLTPIFILPDFENGTLEASSNITVQNNYIGVAADGVTSLPNSGTGIIAVGGDDVYIVDNIIQGHDGGGVHLFGLGTNTAYQDIAILGNSVYNNGGKAILSSYDADVDFVADSLLSDVTPNDIGDTDEGPNAGSFAANNLNHLLNYPVIYRARDNGDGTSTVEYFLDVPAGDYRIEFFENDEIPTSRHGEGKTFLDFHNITHAGNGVETFSKTLSVSINDIVSSTATERNQATNSTFGATSEFGNTVTIDAPGVDFGDALNDYSTNLTSNGPYHIVDGTTYLGDCVDADTDTTSGITNVDGDTCDDGVTFPSSIDWNTTVSLTVKASVSGELNAWVDLNRDGDFDASDKIADDEALSAGNNTITFNVPAGGGYESTYARFRFNSASANGDSDITFQGEVLDGEVEDYKIFFGNPPSSSGGGGGSSRKARCDIDADQTSITPGTSVVLSWDTNMDDDDLTEAIITYVGEDLAAEGEVVVSPTETTTYEGTFEGRFYGGTADCEVTITVEEETEEPVLPPVEPQEPTVEPITPTEPVIEPTEPIEPVEPVTPTEPVIEEPVIEPVPEVPEATTEVSQTSNTNRTLLVAGVLSILGLIASATAVPLRLQNILLAIPAYRRRHRPWGTVYDAETKQPLDPVYVQLLNEQGEEVQSAITDLDGRYGFLAEPGTYYLKAGKTHYSFPSEQLHGDQRDNLYTDLYFGEKVTITEEGQVIAKNIPMDATGADWNEDAKRSMKVTQFFSRTDGIAHRIIDVLFVAGIATSIYAFFANPAWYNAVVLGAYAFFVGITLLGLLVRNHGTVTNTEGVPLAGAILRLYNTATDTEIAHRVVGDTGAYYMLVANGEYYMTLEDHGKKIFSSDSFKVRNGMVKKNVVVG